MLSTDIGTSRATTWAASLSIGVIAVAAAAGGTGAPTGAPSGGSSMQEAGGPLAPQPGMGDPLPELTSEQLDRWLIGRDVFREPLEIAAGLGPAMNRRACGRCHIDPLTGGSSNLKVTRFGRVDENGVFDPLEEYGGSLLQMIAINQDCGEEVPPEANVMSERVTNGAMGYGLIEAIPDEAILVLEQDPPGISGRAHIVESFEDPGVERVGRFGWKAQVATILTFSADAARNEMGLTNRFVPTEPDPNGIRPPSLAECDDVADPEDGPDEEGYHLIDRVTDFQRFLAAPPQTPRSGMIGEGIFAAIGCTDCHHPTFTTRDDPDLEPALRNRTIRPYSDFLLHDMGEAGDGIAQGDAGRFELRTPPLWGVENRTNLWHDGRFADWELADRLRAAIEQHGAEGSEAAGVHAAWAALESAEQEALLRFLGSLGRREFDWDSNEIIILNDFVGFAGCFTGPGEHYTPEDPCAVSDIDQDGDVDLDDYASFLIAYTGPIDDCNENGEPDLDDILLGRSEDENANGVPDECEACNADVDGDGLIGFSDVLVILAAWGECPALCPLDLDRSDRVDFGDLLMVLENWGPCI